MPNEGTAKAEYEVLQCREIGGQYRAVGDVVQLTPRQAQYYLPPYAVGLKLVVPKAVKAKAADKLVTSDA